MLLREEADLVDRCWCELVDGEEMKLRVGVLLGLELGFLGVFCSAAATARPSTATSTVSPMPKFFSVVSAR